LKARLELKEEFTKGYRRSAEGLRDCYHELESRLAAEENRNKRLQKVADDAMELAKNAMIEAK
jgi:hypothetical protein